MKRVLLGAAMALCAGCAPILADRAITGSPRAATTGGVPTVQGEWRVAAIGAELVAAGNAPTLSVVGDRVAGTTGCNSYSAPLQADGEGFVIGNAISTRKACGEAIMSQEYRFLRALESVERTRRVGHQLLLVDRSGQVQLRLVPR